MKNLNVYEVNYNAEKTGEKIMECLREKGMSLRELSETMGITYQAVYSWIKDDKKSPSIDNMCILSAILGKKLNDIVVIDGLEECLME